MGIVEEAPRHSEVPGMFYVKVLPTLQHMHHTSFTRQQAISAGGGKGAL